MGVGRTWSGLASLWRALNIEGERCRRIDRDWHDRIGRGLSVAHRRLELYDVCRDAEPTRAAAKVAIAQRANLESMALVRSTPGRGTQVDVCVPLRRRASNDTI